jgi:AraC family transcriptional regulator
VSNEVLDMEPRFVNLKEKKLIGKKLTMSLSYNKTPELWQSFMPKRKEIRNNINSDFYSVEVNDFNTVPDDMETLILSEGLYAVFIYKGPSSAAPKLYWNIFENWLPESDYLLDSRPHFALMGE